MRKVKSKAKRETCYYCGKEIKGGGIPVKIAESPKDYLGGGLPTMWHKECCGRGLSKEWLEENSHLFE